MAYTLSWRLIEVNSVEALDHSTKTKWPEEEHAHARGWAGASDDPGQVSDEETGQSIRKNKKVRLVPVLTAAETVRRLLTGY